MPRTWGRTTRDITGNHQEGRQHVSRMCRTLCQCAERTTSVPSRPILTAHLSSEADIIDKILHLAYMAELHLFLVGHRVFIRLGVHSPSVLYINDPHSAVGRAVNPSGLDAKSADP